jgi:hypothetical protein
MKRLPETLCRMTLPVAALLLSIAVPALAQDRGTLNTEENFRDTPNGELLARLDAGATFAVVAQEGNWLEVDLVGWVWMRSLQISEDPDYDLVVSEAEGENLRDGPQGTILGRLARGALLEELGREPGWIEVRRSGFIWAESVEVDASLAGGATPSTGATLGEGDSQEGPPPPSASRPGGFVGAGPAGSAILTAPDGDTLALAVPDSELQVTAREGNWVRVRLEGWAWMPDTPTDQDVAEGQDILEPADLGRDPDEFAGRVVSWRLQFVSLERAEAVRTDFFEGEPFILARYGGDSGPFVYVAVPPDRLTGLDGLIPLEYLTVTARVRTGASALTGTPIVDLISFERAGR